MDTTTTTTETDEANPERAQGWHARVGTTTETEYVIWAGIGFLLFGAVRAIQCEADEPPPPDHMVYGKWYSAIVPTGEWGFNARSELLCPVASEADFAIIRQLATDQPMDEALACSCAWLSFASAEPAKLAFAARYGEIFLAQ